MEKIKHNSDLGTYDFKSLMAYQLLRKKIGTVYIAKQNATCHTVSLKNGAIVDDDAMRTFKIKENDIALLVGVHRWQLKGSTDSMATEGFFLIKQQTTDVNATVRVYFYSTESFETMFMEIKKE